MRMTKMMPEAEVSLRIASWLIDQGLAVGAVKVAIDGAQVRLKDRVHFDLPLFLAKDGWAASGEAPSWQCGYHRGDGEVRIRVHSVPGKGDVVASLRSGGTFRSECKKGPLVRSKNSQEYPLLHEALGQLLTVREVGDKDILAVAVPHSERFQKLAAEWRRAPLVKRLGIRILTVSQEGAVYGFEKSA
jgi:hypothetical protein